VDSALLRSMLFFAARNQARTRDRPGEASGEGYSLQHKSAIALGHDPLLGFAKQLEQIHFQHRRNLQQQEQRGSRPAAFHVTDPGTTQPRSRSERLLRQAALLAEFHQQLDQLGNDGRVRIEHHAMVGTLSFLEYALIRAGTAQSIMGPFLAFKGLRKTAVETKNFAPLSAPAARGITLRVFPRETRSVDDLHRFRRGAVFCGKRFELPTGLHASGRKVGAQLGSGGFDELATCFCTLVPSPILGVLPMRTRTFPSRTALKSEALAVSFVVVVALFGICASVQALLP
jgi:hypothetical protein